MSTAAAALGLGQNLRHNLALFCRPEHACNAFYGLVVTASQLRRTSGDIYKRIWILPVQLPDYITAFLVGMLGYGTRVHKEHVSALVPWHCLEAFLEQFTLISGSLRIIQLTSQCYKCYLLHFLCNVILDHCTMPDTGGLRLDTRTEKEVNSGNLASSAFTMRPATCSSRSDGFAISSATTSYISA